MRTFRVTVFILSGVVLLALGIQRLLYIHPDWREWVAIAIGIYFVTRGYLALKSKGPV